MAQLTQDQLDHFEDQGYVVVPGVIPHDVLDNVITEYEGVLDTLIDELYERGDISSRFEGLEFGERFIKLVIETGEVHKRIRMDNIRRCWSHAFGPKGKSVWVAASEKNRGPILIKVDLTSGKKSVHEIFRNDNEVEKRFVPSLEMAFSPNGKFLCVSLLYSGFISSNNDAWGVAPDLLLFELSGDDLKPIRITVPRP